MKRVLVTGAAGFIGSHLTERLLRENCEVVAIDNLSVGRRANLSAASGDPRLSFHQLDVNDPAAAELFGGVDTLFHLAALADIVPSIEHPQAYFRSNVDGTFAVVEAARSAGVRRIVYSASSSCYGLPDAFPTPETAEIRPQYPYALTKYLGERIVLHWGHVYGISTVSLRFFNVFGPRARTSGTYGAVFGVFLAQKLAGKPFTVVGDGAQTRDFTFVRDTARAIVELYNHTESRGKVVNVGTGRETSMLELISLLEDILGKQIPYSFEGSRPGDVARHLADASLLHSLTGYRPATLLRDGLVETVEAYLASERFG